MLKFADAYLQSIKLFHDLLERVLRVGIDQYEKCDQVYALDQFSFLLLDI